MALLVAGQLGCRQQVPVSNREGMRVIKRLYVVCNSRNSQKLTQVEEDIASLAKDGKITPVEKNAFNQVTAMAREGKWANAEQEALRLADDQIGNGNLSGNDSERGHAK